MFFLFPKSSLIFFLLEQGLENIFCRRLENKDFRLCCPRPVRVTNPQLRYCGVKAATDSPTGTGGNVLSETFVCFLKGSKPVSACRV